MLVTDARNVGDIFRCFRIDHSDSPATRVGRTPVREAVSLDVIIVKADSIPAEKSFYLTRSLALVVNFVTEKPVLLHSP